MTAPSLAAVTLPPGVHPNIPDSRYHGDPCAQPSLSASVAHILTTASPAHARAAHPRLNPDYVPQAEEKFDVGTVVHSMLLEGISAVQIVNAPDWRTKKAQEERDLARAHGLVPMLAHQFEQVQAMTEAVREQLAAYDCVPEPLTAGKPEQTIVWDDNGVLCRARIDWLHDVGLVVDDVKTTSRSADPERWSRGALYDHGCDIQAAFYLRGLRALTGADYRWRWVVAETQPPYAVSVIEPAASVLAIGDAKVDRALSVWRDCLATNTWPAYPAEVHRAELPHWIESQWLEKETREAA